ncbi:TolC family outer membrane protein [Alkalilacustris brevis]|uniref:TolC family outer membrane protein n=1 Tax=Alkalilacustris brevis TaxID=2026338 RepID=UPI000E0DD834|nr:TolC family outer membrane protein [Alkalilacustris brevis]
MRGIRQAVSAVICSLAVIAAPPVWASSLTDALIAAYRNSNLLEQNRAVLRATDEDAASALASLRPVLNFVSSFTMTNAPVNNITGSLGLNAELTIVDFGRGQLALEAARENVLATRQALIGVEQQVLLSAVAAYVDVRSAIDTVRLRENNVRLITEELRAAQDRFEVGEITRTDVAIAEARLAAARSNLAAAQGDLAVAREAFRLATGEYPGALRDLPPPPRLPSSLEEAQQLARNTHPSIRQARHEANAADKNVARAAAVRHGTVGASAGWSIDQDRDTSANMRLSYSRPIYQGGAISSAHRRAIAQRDASLAGLHRTVAVTLQDVGRAWSDMNVARARIEASQLQISAAQTAYDGVSQEAALGARTTLDVLNAEQELLDARATRITAEAGRYVATYALLSSIGLLTVDHLNLGITTYDPEAYYNAVRNAPVTSPQGESLDRVLRSIGRP